MFNIEEITLMNPDKHLGRQKLIEALKKMEPHLEDEDMKELVSGTIRKLTAITDQQFHEIDFTLALDIED